MLARARNIRIAQRASSRVIADLPVRASRRHARRLHRHSRKGERGEMMRVRALRTFCLIEKVTCVEVDVSEWPHKLKNNNNNNNISYQQKHAEERHSSVCPPWPVHGAAHSPPLTRALFVGARWQGKRARQGGRCIIYACRGAGMRHFVTFVQRGAPITMSRVWTLRRQLEAVSHWPNSTPAVLLCGALSTLSARLIPAVSLSDECGRGARDRAGSVALQGHGSW